MPGIDLPSGIKTLNPVPVEFWSGPYTGADETAAKLAANTAIPSAVRFLTMEVSLIIAGIGYKYWYKDGIADLDLVKVDTDISNLVTLNTNQTITGIKSFQNESLTLFGINGGGPHIVSVRADDGGGTIIFEEVGAGGDAVVAYRSWVTSQLGSALPSQTGNGGKWLQTNGTVASWQTLDTSVVSENTNLYFTNARAIGATLTGYTSGAGTISSADNILQAIQKLNGNIAGLVTGVSSFNTRTGAITLTSLDVTDALTFTPYNASNPNNYIPLTALSSSATGLTYTNTTGVFSLTSGYVIPTTTQETDWNTAYGWGNHASADYLASSTATSTYIPYSNANTNIDLNAKQLKNVSAFEATSIGIGRSPISKLNVYDITNNSSINVRTYVGGLDIQNGDATPGSYALLRFGNYESYSSSPTGIDGTYIQSIIKGNNNTDLAFGNYQTGSGGLINEIMRLTQAGNVGIGTTAPTGLLQVHGSANEVIVDSTGRLGIGFANASAMNASAAYKLQVNGAFTFGDGTNILGRSTYTAVGGNPAFASESGKGFTFYVDNTNVRAIDISSAGNVGIGTTGPISPLTVQTNSIGVITASFINTQAGAYTSGSGGAGMVGYSDNGAATTNDARLGWLGFGGAINSSHTLARPILIAAVATENWSGSANGADLTFATTQNGTTARVERMRITGSGNIGIGTTIPYSKLEVSGGIKMSDDTDTASINKVGTLRYRKSGNNTYCEMCMQTGASSYDWIAIIQNNW